MKAVTPGYLRTKLLQSEWTASQFAHVCELSPTTVYSYLRGNHIHDYSWARIQNNIKVLDTPVPLKWRRGHDRRTIPDWAVQFYKTMDDEMRRRGMTVCDMVDMTGFSQNSIINYRHDSERPGVGRYNKLAEIFGWPKCSLDLKPIPMTGERKDIDMANVAWSTKDAATYEDIPDGIYLARIASADFECVTSTGKDMWKFKLDVKGYQRQMTHVIVVGSDKKAWVRSAIANMAVCFGIQSGSNEESDWIGHTGIIETKHTTVDDGNEYINVKKFYTPKRGQELMFKQKQEREAKAFSEAMQKSVFDDLEESQSEPVEATPSKQVQWNEGDAKSFSDFPEF